MCKIVGREGTYCKFGGDTCIDLEDIARKIEGARNTPPPVGRGLKEMNRNKIIFLFMFHVYVDAAMT